MAEFCAEYRWASQAPRPEPLCRKDQLMKPEAGPARRKFAWFPVVAQFWMIAVLLLFFVLRVVGSSTGQTFLRKLGVH
jgi:hypothetical protein